MQFVQVIILNVQKATELTDKSDGMYLQMKSLGKWLRYLIIKG